MKLAIFGGTGRTGIHLVQQALADGYEVKVMARTPSKISTEDKNLTIIKGDIKDQSAVEKTITGVDAVLSVLGPTSNKPTFEVSQGMEKIINTMKEHGVNRLIVSAGAGVGDPNDEPKFTDRVITFMLKLMARNVLEDMSKVVEIVRASELDWTVVRLPMLTDGPKSGQVKVAYVGKGLGARITRGDLAEFMLSQVNDPSYVHQSPAISN